MEMVMVVLVLVCGLVYQVTSAAGIFIILHLAQVTNEPKIEK